LIAVVGVLFYGEELDIFLLIGGALMLLGNLVNVQRNVQCQELVVSAPPKAAS
jgi:drug/metabolite transporter (DMT)-like permease